MTGLHKVVVAMTDDAFYTAGSDYVAVISTGTADSISIVGGIAKEWSCENRFNEVDVTKQLGVAVTDVYQAVVKCFDTGSA